MKQTNEEKSNYKRTNNKLINENPTKEKTGCMEKESEKVTMAGANKKLDSPPFVTNDEKDDNRGSDTNIGDGDGGGGGGGEGGGGGGKEETIQTEKSLSTFDDVSLPNKMPQATNFQFNKEDDESEDDDDDDSDDSDAIEVDRRISSDEEIDGSYDQDDDHQSEDRGSGDNSDENEIGPETMKRKTKTSENEMAKKPSKDDCENINPKSPPRPRPPNRSMVVTRLNLEHESGFVDFIGKETLLQKGDLEEEEDENEDEEKEAPSHSVDPFFSGGGSSSAVKRKLEEEEDEDDFDNDRFTSDDEDDREANELTSTFVGLRGSNRGHNIRSRGDNKRGRVDFRGGGGERGAGRGEKRGSRGGERGGRGGERGRGGVTFGRGRGEFGRGGRPDRGSVRGFVDRGRGSSDRGGRGRGFANSFDNPKPSMDESNLHPSWQAKRKQKVQISVSTSQAGKKITFVD